MLTTIILILIGAIIGFAAGCIIGFKIGYEGVINDIYNHIGGRRNTAQSDNSDEKTE